MTTSDRFDERTLLADVVKQWGEYGAHADLVAWMIAEIERLRNDLWNARSGAALLALERERALADSLAFALREESRLASPLAMTVHALADWEEARRD